MIKVQLYCAHPDDRMGGKTLKFPPDSCFCASTCDRALWNEQYQATLLKHIQNSNKKSIRRFIQNEVIMQNHSAGVMPKPLPSWMSVSSSPDTLLPAWLRNKLRAWRSTQSHKNKVMMLVQSVIPSHPECYHIALFTQPYSALKPVSWKYSTVCLFFMECQFKLMDAW